MPEELEPGIKYIGIGTPFYCNDGNGLFVLHKRSEACRDERGRWDFGSGQLEFGENLVEGALREVKGEYGCDGIIQEQLPPHSIIREHDGVKTHWLAIPFLIKVDFEQVRNNDPDKISEIGFFTLDKLPQPLHNGAAFTMNKYKEYFERYKKSAEPKQ